VTAAATLSGQPCATRVAYVIGRFPKLTETFVLGEILAMRRIGVDVAVFPLLRTDERVMHPGSAEVLRDARFAPGIGSSLLAANARALARAPVTYLSTLVAVVSGNLRSARFLAAAIVVFPKAVWIAATVRSGGVDAIHCHFATHAALAGYVVHRLTGVPFSFTAHGSDIHVDRTMLCQKVDAAQAVIAISEFNREVILDACPRSTGANVVVVHTGVDTERMRPRAVPRAAPVVITCVGTLHEVKGQAFLVDACARLAADGHDVTLRLVGDGEDRADLAARAADAGIPDRVVFEGRRSQDEVHRILSESDIAVTPSVPTRSGRREGIPVALMEAMSVGLPVVASRLSGIPELVEDGATGLLVPPGDVDALVVAIRTLIDDPQLRVRLGHAGRERVVHEFDIHRNARRIADLLGWRGAT
jgi:colanic acid/amylovoran biosynthesis glycosyltransferase